MQRGAALVLAALIGLSAVSVQALTVCQTYVVQSGDTVGTIASQFGLTVPVLEAALESCDLLVTGYQPGQFLQQNQKICLPGWVPACLQVSSAGGIESCKYYTVQQGDTLDTIGNYFGIPRADIVAVNPEINPATLAVNSFVKLPDWDSSVCPAPGGGQACRYYVADNGDSLSSIATAFSILLADLQAANQNLGGDAMAVLQPGQKVKLPPYPDSCGDGVSVPKPSNCRGYQVVAGDTVASIAAMFQTSSADLVATNPELAAGGVLQPGSIVKLPPADASCVNPELVSGVPSPPSPPSPPLSPPPPPSPPTPSPSPSPSPSPIPEPVAPLAPEAAPEAAPAPEAGSPELAPAPEPAPEPVETPAPAPSPAAAPAPAPAPASGASAASLLVALLALAGGALALF